MMRRTMRRTWMCFALLLVAACGPTVSESRVAFFPSRGENCDLEFVQASGADMSPGGKWRVIGYVTVGGIGQVDPFAPKNRDLVRPRVCAMGGTAVTIAISGGTETMINSGSTVMYAALRPASEPAPQLPQKF